MSSSIHSPILPELHIPLELSPSNGLASLLQQIVQRLLLVKENVKVVADNMSVGASRTLNQDSTAVISMLRDTMGRAVSARFAGESKLVCGLLLSAQSVLLCGVGVFV